MVVAGVSVTITVVVAAVVAVFLLLLFIRKRTTLRGLHTTLWIGEGKNRWVYIYR